MGLFDKLFGKGPSTDQVPDSAETGKAQLQKGDALVSIGDNDAFKVIRPLTEEQKAAIDKSTILLRTGQLYMHYWTEGLADADRNDPEWQNKVMFFWKAEEPFPKKSLPPEFENFKTRYFLFTGDTSGISLQVAQAAPWFGMPGLGEKHVCEINGQKITIPELAKLGLIEYVEQVVLASDNLSVLTDRENYFFLIDDRITPFQNGIFYLKGKPVSIDLAYSIGGIHLIKKE